MLMLIVFHLVELKIQTLKQKNLLNDIQKIPSKRMGEASEISDLIYYLLSDDSKYINGENIIIDGGYSSKL